MGLQRRPRDAYNSMANGMKPNHVRNKLLHNMRTATFARMHSSGRVMCIDGIQLNTTKALLGCGLSKRRIAPVNYNSGKDGSNFMRNAGRLGVRAFRSSSRDFFSKQQEISSAEPFCAVYMDGCWCKADKFLGDLGEGWKLIQPGGTLMVTIIHRQRHGSIFKNVFRIICEMQAKGFGLLGGGANASKAVRKYEHRYNLTFVRGECLPGATNDLSGYELPPPTGGLRSDLGRVRAARIRSKLEQMRLMEAVAIVKRTLPARVSICAKTNKDVAIWERLRAQIRNLDATKRHLVLAALEGHWLHQQYLKALADRQRRIRRESREGSPVLARLRVLEAAAAKEALTSGLPVLGFFQSASKFPAAVKLGAVCLRLGGCAGIDEVTSRLDFAMEHAASACSFAVCFAARSPSDTLSYYVSIVRHLAAAHRLERCSGLPEALHRVSDSDGVVMDLFRRSK